MQSIGTVSYTHLRFQAATGQLEQTARLKEVKKQIARIKTVQSEAK